MGYLISETQPQSGLGFFKLINAGTEIAWVPLGLNFIDGLITNGAIDAYHDIEP